MKSPEPTSTLHLERILPGPIERVWAYLTESEKRSTWLARGEMDLVTGGSVQLTWFNSTLTAEVTPERFAALEGKSMTGVITACDPPRVLAFTWPQNGSDTEVRFELESKGLEVRLQLTHTKLVKQEQRIAVTAGWTAHLAVMQARLAGTEPAAFWAHYQQVEAELR
jgi:uncharacterized protein YndB with AHSA1/START domain